MHTPFSPDSSKSVACGWRLRLTCLLSTVAPVGFFASVCYHTPYAIPWVVPAVAFFTFDFLARLIRMSFKDAYLEAPDKQITLVRILT